MSSKIYKPQTLAIQAGYTKDTQKTMSVPIYQSTAYEFDNAEQAGARFALKELGNIYSRLTNPTNDVLEKRLAALEGGASAVVTSSGSSAIFYAIANIAQAGDNILIADKIYGGSSNLFLHTLKRFGIQARVFCIDDISTLEALIDTKTKAIFFESLSNPQIAIAPIEEIVAIAKKHSIISICDNTVATPILCNPIKWGVDVVVHSLSKYISGQGSVIAGAIIDSPSLNHLIKNNPRYEHFNTPDTSYHGLVYADVNLPIFNLRVRTALLRDIGASLSAFNSWIVLQGLETLKVRIYEHSLNAQKIASFLCDHPKIKSVNYPSIQNSPYKELAKKYFKDNLCSGLVSFEIKGDFEEAKKVCNSTNLFSIVVNIGDTKSLIVHPASTTHSQLSKEELEKANISSSLIRLSVGIEDAEDLIEDLTIALK
ncbi:O-acetylhomoserine aminocarboxypropyltransferase/cysteine synthase family protein [Helicobacter cappadocius]|uniref:Aminotransferase class I/II-fold pyridoxal phosphate-dependent enzyme n=1 Tax=Helicobacter cappadocius TaxID=3063998 RepID=A0AA90T8W1_9HELI|nr:MULTISPECIES: aminotransferase class I/II-fold pyridoxal phosphate-dependent enzyme [unclassified Helicobacter]MDO7252340.1 aminotransferase class I/II-fold pyridoxal phosphate-dependent enzyme [Helicobacter sp. faydin-H75]MDP2538207.1 aminotransferase class I/II-fold pyridoxal phosphate-dependent enzyme [Helicobacter sp. faydin-H76]